MIGFVIVSHSEPLAHAVDERDAAGDRSRKSASSARACRASASYCRAARRQRPWPNHVAMPPAITPKIATAMMTMNSGSVTPSPGSLELNGSNDSVTTWRLATANTTNRIASGIITSALKILRSIVRPRNRRSR